ncbi:MAG: hypothetical protein GY835_01720 [bacterium]|nr:hypothetical protein [bacterium]
MTTDNVQPAPRKSRRVLKRVLRAVAALLLLLILTVVALLSLRPGREILLRKALNVACARLPGNLAVAEPTWPGLGRLHLENLLWTCDADTLVACTTLDLDLAIAPLIRKNVNVRHLLLDGLFVDLPALQSALPTAPPGDTSAVKPPLPAPDSLLATLPEITLAEIRIAGREIRVAPTLTLVDLLLQASSRAGHADGNHVTLDSLVVVAGDDLWALERCRLRVDLDALESTGTLEARINHLQAGLRLEGRYADSLTLRLSPVHLTTAAHEAVATAELPLTGGLTLDPHSSRLTWRELGLSGALGEFDCSGEMTPSGAMQVSLNAVWPEPPEAGLHALLPDSLTADLPPLADIWPAEGPSIELRVNSTSFAPPTGAFNLALHLPELTVNADGHTADGKIAAKADIELTGLDYLAKLVPALAGVTAQLQMELRAEGPIANPSIDLEFEAAATTPAVSAPRITGRLTEIADRRVLSVRAPEGLHFATMSLDSCDLLLRTPADTLAAFPLTLELDTGGEPVGLGLAFDLTQRDAKLHLAADSLGLRVYDQWLAGREPFTIDIDPATQHLEIAGLRLTGDLGEVAAEGRVTADSLALSAAVDLTLPPALLQRLLPEGSRPRARNLSLGFKADLDLAGSVTAPDAGLRANVGLRDPDKGRELDLALDLKLNSSQEPGVEGNLDLADEQGSLLTGTLTLPGGFDPESPGWVTPTGKMLECDLGPSTIEFKRLKPYLPELVDLEGILHLALSARGRSDSLGLDGRIRTESFVVRWDRQSWIAADADLELTGDTRKPGIRGELATKSGIIHLPPPPRVLLPDTGNALLWDIALAADSVTASADPASEVRTAPPPLPDLNIKVVVPGELWLRGQGLELELGGELRITSMTEGAAAGQPLVAGEFGLRSGHYDLLGRRFELERGTATLFGQQEPNPDLDVVLASQLGDTRVFVKVAGTAKTPTLRLESEPERSESEILALLLSGGASDEGGEDPGAKEQLRSAAAGLLGALGSAALKQSVARHTGLDQVEYQEGSDGKRGSMLLGKYLSPRLLLQYEQGLEESSDFIVHLRYLLNRFWKVETSYAQNGESGIELHWSRED